jgi:hypothetical protein
MYHRTHQCVFIILGPWAVRWPTVTIDKHDQAIIWIFARRHHNTIFKFLVDETGLDWNVASHTSWT